MNFRHINLIIKREYIEKLRSPGFIMGTILGIIGIAGLSFLPQLLQLLDQETKLKIAVVDTRNLIYPYLSIDDTPPAQSGTNSEVGQENPSISARLDISKADTDDQAMLSERVKQEKLDGYIMVEGTKPSEVQFKLHTKQRPDTVTTARILALFTSAAVQAKLRGSGITPEQAAALFGAPDFKVEPIVGGTLKDEKAVFQSQALVYFLLILLYGTTVMYGIQVSMGVVYEKSTRVMEILITSVRPIELMLGKVFGIGLLGLTQYALWVGLGLVGFLLSSNLISNGSNGEGSGLPIEIALIPPGTLISFLVFFVLGYLVYAALYAALGSLVNRIEDVNSITTPLTLMLVGVYFLSLLALGNPEADYVKWLSFVPFFSPMLMFIRISLSSPALWEPLLSIALLVASIFFFSWVAAKIYRVGVLLYGKRPSFREIGRLLRTT